MVAETIYRTPYILICFIGYLLPILLLYSASPPNFCIASFRAPLFLCPSTALTTKYHICWCTLYYPDSPKAPNPSTPLHSYAHDIRDVCVALLSKVSVEILLPLFQHSQQPFEYGETHSILAIVDRIQQGCYWATWFITIGIARIMDGSSNVNKSNRRSSFFFFWSQDNPPPG